MSKPSIQSLFSKSDISTDPWKDLKKNEFKWHNTVALRKFPGHYMTFLEPLEVGKEMHKTGEFTSN